MATDAHKRKCAPYLKLLGAVAGQPVKGRGRRNNATSAPVSAEPPHSASNLTHSKNPRH